MLHDRLAAFDAMGAELARVSLAAPYGRVSGIGAGLIEVAGLAGRAAIGDRVIFASGAGGEVIRLGPAGASVLPEADVTGLCLETPVRLLGSGGVSPDEGWIGRIVDPFGQPLDGQPLMRGPGDRPLRRPPPPAAQRRPLGQRLQTGLLAFDTLLPLVEGQRIGLFAGSGVGKSSLLSRFARGIAADVVVIGLVGERGREVREFAERTLGPAGMAKSVIVAATSDRSALARRRCALSAMAVAEHFRDSGRRVLLLMDSVTRFAEAHREIALAAGEAATMRGFPPSLTQEIMALAERAGPGVAGTGSITAVFSVLVAGSDMEEPVADILRGVLDGHVVMDRAIAERGRFPAVDVLRSVSRSLPAAASAEENRLIAEARRLIGAWDRAEVMIQAGLYARGSDPAVDAAMRVWPALDAALAEDAPADGIAGSFRRLAEVLAPALLPAQA